MTREQIEKFHEAEDLLNEVKAIVVFETNPPMVNEKAIEYLMANDNDFKIKFLELRNNFYLKYQKMIDEI